MSGRRDKLDLKALRRERPPGNFVDGVMGRVAAEPAPERVPVRANVRRTWLWLSYPALASLGATIVALFVLTRASGPPETEVAVADAAAPAPVPAETALAARAIPATFQLRAPHAKAVFVAGDFNGWQPTAMTPARQADGVFKAVLPLPAGTHEYQFLVDGQWMVDPSSPEQRPDGFGRANSVLRL